MKTSKIFLTAAALCALTVGARGAEVTAPSEEDEFLDSTPAAPAVIENGKATIAGKEYNSSGIVVHDGAAWIIHRLQGEMALPNGSKVEPNGTVVGGDGKAQLMTPNQMMTLDGQIKPAPFSAGESKGLFDQKLPTNPDAGTRPGDFFAPSSGTFPGVSDTLGYDSSADLPATPDESDFSD